MQGELDNLVNYCLKLSLVNELDLQRVGIENLRQAIGQFLVYCPVYRMYGNNMPLDNEEAAEVQQITDKIAIKRALQPAAQLLKEFLIVKPLDNKAGFNDKVLRFYKRLMQFSGPLMAKGVEDTLMYTYNNFIGHNEVGDTPDAFGLAVKDFHKLMKQRQNHWPLSLNATQTHDTKRGEDVRARLNVFTAIPDEWFTALKHWQSIEPVGTAPDANDKYFIYQTIIGAYPMPGQDDSDFDRRLIEYLIKALREGNQNSDWAKPNEAYENATTNFTSGLLNKQGDFWRSFTKFHSQIADHGIVNSLVQVLLKFTCPGVPDVYQGCELWDLSLVDPDNRRSVDYQLREELLDTSLPPTPIELTQHLWATRYSGQIKLWLTRQLFKLRRSDNKLFTSGEYIPP